MIHPFKRHYVLDGETQCRSLTTKKGSSPLQVFNIKYKKKTKKKHNFTFFF